MHLSGIVRPRVDPADFLRAVVHCGDKIADTQVFDQDIPARGADGGAFAKADNAGVVIGKVLRLHADELERPILELGIIGVIRGFEVGLIQNAIVFVVSAQIEDLVVIAA